MGLFGSSSKNRTQVTTSNVSTTRDIGFTGQAGVDLATNLALIGNEAGRNASEVGAESGRNAAAVGLASGQSAISAAERVAGEFFGAVNDFASEAFDATNDNAILASNNLRAVTQASSAGFNRLVGGASELVKTAGAIGDDSRILAEGQIASGQSTFQALLATANDTFDRVVGAARGVAEDLTQGSTAFVEGATATVERLGPQTKQNQNIAFAGIAAAVVVTAVVLLRKK